MDLNKLEDKIEDKAEGIWAKIKKNWVWVVVGVVAIAAVVVAVA